MAKDGGIFSFGDAKYLGSLPALHVNVTDIVGITASTDGGGYWLVAKDGGIFSFGDAKYFGSLPGLHVSVSNIVGIAATSDGGGYWLVGSDGGVFGFGDAKYFGSLPGSARPRVEHRGPGRLPGQLGTGRSDPTAGCSASGTPATSVRCPGSHIHVSNIVGMVPDVRRCLPENSRPGRRRLGHARSGVRGLSVRGRP